MVYEKIRAIIIDHLGVDESKITPETNFRKDLNADSLDLFQIINEIEEEYGITIDNADNFTTVGDAVAYVEKEAKSK